MLMEDLRLCNCQISESGVSALARNVADNGRLRSFNLNRNPVRKSKPLLDELRHALYRNTSLVHVVVPELTTQGALQDELQFIRNQNSVFRKAEVGDAGLAYFSERMWTQGKHRSA